MNKNIKLAAALLQKCLPCFYNFVQSMCDSTCSPNQASFMKVREEMGQGANKSVKSVDISITEQYINGTFDSCREVSR